MADDPDFSTSTTPTMQQLVDYAMDSFFDEKRIKQFQTAMVNAHAEGAIVARGAEVGAAPALGEKKQNFIKEGEEAIAKAMAVVLSHLVAHMVGIEVPRDALSGSGVNPETSPIGVAIARTLMHGVTGDTTELVPSDEGATRFVGMLSHLVLTSWFEGILGEEALSLGGILKPVEAVSSLGRDLINGLGFSRLARIALRPLAQDLIATPLQWKVNKTFQPTLLSPSTALRQFLRGKWDWADVEEELTRQGYSSERIDALLNELGKFFSPGDVSELVESEEWTAEEGLQHLHNAGYDDDHARDAMRLEGKRIIKAINDQIISAATAAYVRGDINDVGWEKTIGPLAVPSHQAAFAKSVAQTKRALSMQALTSSEAHAAAKVGIVAVGDYREALRREGRTEDAILVLELLLRHELDEKQSADELRAAAAADRAQEKADKQAAADAKRQAIADALALKRRGALSELEHAVVIGLIPIARLEEVLNANFDGDTVAIYVADVEQQRVAYLADQKKRDDAAKRADLKGLNIGQLEQAVYTGVLTVDEFRARVRASGLADADTDVLTRTVAAKLADLVAAKKRQAEAIAAAAKKGIDLAALEQLVLRGLRPMAAYDAQLRALGYDDAARAGLRELLQARIAEKAAADALRKQVGAGGAPRGLSLEQFRKAVIAGAKTIDQFQTFLVAEKYTTDAQVVLVDELRADVDAAAAAQQRRDQADAASGRAGLSVATAARAARLGLITPDAYQQALVDAGYSDDNIALELELLVAEMATTTATRKRAAATATPTSAHGLTLAQIAAAVKTGAATRADFQSAAAAAGLDDDAIATLLAQLDDELAGVADAKGRRQQLVPALLAQGIDLADLEQQVRARALTVAAFEAQLTALGYPAADAQLVGSLLETELA